MSISRRQKEDDGETKIVLYYIFKQVRSDNDPSELVILGHFERHFVELGTLREVGEEVRMIPTIPMNFGLFPSQF